MGIFKKKTKEEVIKPLTKEDFDKLNSAIEARQTARSIVNDHDRAITKLRSSVLCSLKNCDKEPIGFAFKRRKDKDPREQWVKIIGTFGNGLSYDNVLAVMISQIDDVQLDVVCTMCNIYSLVTGDYETVSLEEFDEALQNATKYLQTR